ncbi:MAG: bifunctional aspartate kinase/homoserine dehydrogenase, partial [Sediminibacterium sp.]|nr:bifunctional aspartate kinase/homoserine dehydrogenase [Sediminibacterium sp.]
MQVLKFGGSSVANAANIHKVIAIVQQAIRKEPVVLVVSAMGGVTDHLLQAGDLASMADENYKQLLKDMENRHLDAVRELLPIQQQSATLSIVKQQFNELDGICDGVFLLGELSPRTRDRIAGYGELLSSLMISAAVQAMQIDQAWVDARKLVTTNNHHGNAAVDHTVTDKKIQTWFAQNPHQLYIVPGFIASDTQGNITTLGRGGSDYTAAIFASALHAGVLEIWTDVSGMMTADP